MDESRKARLRSFFIKVIRGDDTVRSPERAKRFVEAVCSETDPVGCVSQILSSRSGLPALQAAIRIDTTKSFVNTTIQDLLKYLQSPELAVACNGDLLRRTLHHLAEPPVFFNEFVRHAKNAGLTEETLQSFAWLLLQLVSLPEHESEPFRQVACQAQLQAVMKNASRLETRNTYKRIYNTVSMLNNPGTTGTNGPGGRHDNDMEDFRKVAILPTVDELLCEEAPFLRFADEVDSVEDDQKLLLHVDNQFRLLREDMVCDLRDEIKSALLPKSTRQKSSMLSGLEFEGHTCDDRNKWALAFRCAKGLSFLPKGNSQKRLDFLKAHRRILAQGSLACILTDGVFAGLGLVWRREDLMAQDVPSVHLHLPQSEVAVKQILSRVREASQIQLLQLHAPIFAYEPVLIQLQNTKTLPLVRQILEWRKGRSVTTVVQSASLAGFIGMIQKDASLDLKTLLTLPHSTKLDREQSSSLLAGLSQDVALVQGPPGTGKSFIGALIVKALHQLTECKILVLSYTNHALDQFLDDLVATGINRADIVRLGGVGKTSTSNKGIVLSELERSSPQYNLTRIDHEMIDSRRQTLSTMNAHLGDWFDKYLKASVTRAELMEYLEFSDQLEKFYIAFRVPDRDDDFRVVARRGKEVDEYYLLDRWMRGKDPGIFTSHFTSDSDVWNMKKDVRTAVGKKWVEDLYAERLSHVVEYGNQYNEILAEINTMFGERGRRLMRDKRIIGCTTTGAAKFVADIQSASPDVVIVEEAGEILESHILTALGPETKQLVLIGDHKQLRPKAHYSLSVEKGKGYDLNRSLFERLVLKGYPHGTLSQQHRMRPEISALVRSLTYPELTDASSTKSRLPLRGFQDNVIFVNHEIPENNETDVYDPREGGLTSTKKNQFEAQLTLKCVRYLAQQGYDSSKVVVLTPYLGQLRLLLDVLSTENDPILNDMDSYDLVRAGLMPAATANIHKNRVRISTIDNYQGEESNVVVVSLTRSNAAGDIGFMQSPERLNVLLSRARDGLILIGNASTFSNARRGREIWIKFLSMMKDASHVYDGFPVRCERHPDRKMLLKCRDDFDIHCPDGGCDQPCEATLSCGLHKCPQKCHQLHDHSKMPCQVIMKDTCVKGHQISWTCARMRPVTCTICERQKKRDEEKLQTEFERLRQEAVAQQQHEQKLAEIDREIEQQQQTMARLRLEEDRQNAIEQKVADLAITKRMAEAAKATVLKRTAAPSENLTSSSTPHVQNVESGKNAQTQNHNKVVSEESSPLLMDWERMKKTENLQSAAIESLMQLTGLDAVKQAFLRILSKVQTAKRQGVDIRSERIGAVFQGNPGTGKTTVARLYGQFLAEVGLISNVKFVETTGAKLANDGVSGTRKQLEDLLKAGGGIFFIDEAYQLTSGNNHGGGAVLDYLLAEIENSRGRVVFVFAGYEKLMEKFFQHNPGLNSRIPHRLKFDDYSQDELKIMLQRKIEKRYNGRMQVDDGMSGLYVRIVIRRLHRGSGREGFGNARELENVLDKVTSAQANRLNLERRQGLKPDDFWLSKEDLIGPEPSQALIKSTARTKLQQMIGLESVKVTVESLLNRLQNNYKRELKELPPVEVSLNRLFLGSPGTGKTTVAKLYGQILADIGMLSSSECVFKTPADFIGSAVGQSEQNTKAILEATKGKVLVIDEAYMLRSNLGSGSSSQADPYRTAIIDTIVSEVQSTPGEDRAVLLLGYQEQMEEMLREVNPGLSRRFPIDNAFVFGDYNDADLLLIMDLKLRQQGITATDDAKRVAIDVLSKARRRPNFGNAGEVENLLSRAKDSFANRQRTLSPEDRHAEICLEPDDFDMNFARDKNALQSCKELFGDVVGSEDLVKKLFSYVKGAENARRMGLDPEQYIPFNYVFKGPPGTGKTTTARKMGQIFYEMGLLASYDIVECSATDLVGEYVGHTGPKVLRKLDEALGKVLFIDEAYRLGDGHFAKEAIDELVDSLTKPRYKEKMIVILAGYELEINSLLSVNPGLSSRFPEEVFFQNLEPEMSVQLLKKKLEQEQAFKFDLSLRSNNVAVVKGLLGELSVLPAWGNGRDIETISKRVVAATLKSHQPEHGAPCITWDRAAVEISGLLGERQGRAKNTTASQSAADTMQLSQAGTSAPPLRSLDSQHATSKSTATDAASSQEQSEEAQNAGPPRAHSDKQRDPGVADAEWHQLCKDDELSRQAEAQDLDTISRCRDDQGRLAAAAEERERQAKAYSEAAAKDDEMRRLHEAMRLEALVAKTKADEERQRLRQLEAQYRKKREEEIKIQQKLSHMGVCCMGFRWIKQSHGYRCAGGSHFVSNQQLGI